MSTRFGMHSKKVWSGCSAAFQVLQMRLCLPGVNVPSSSSQWRSATWGSWSLAWRPSSARASSFECLRMWIACASISIVATLTCMGPRLTCLGISCFVKISCLLVTNLPVVTLFCLKVLLFCLRMAFACVGCSCICLGVDLTCLQTEFRAVALLISLGVMRLYLKMAVTSVESLFSYTGMRLAWSEIAFRWGVMLFSLEALLFRLVKDRVRLLVDRVLHAGRAQLHGVADCVLEDGVHLLGDPVLLLGDQYHLVGGHHVLGGHALQLGDRAHLLEGRDGHVVVRPPLIWLPLLNLGPSPGADRVPPSIPSDCGHRRPLFRSEQFEVISIRPLDNVPGASVEDHLIVRQDLARRHLGFRVRIWTPSANCICCHSELATLPSLCWWA